MKEKQLVGTESGIAHRQHKRDKKQQKKALKKRERLEQKGILTS